ncbi:MAG: peptidylprolyl isomerase [Gemmatimonadetes bacterium]|jgi:peptidyl-prolyl cis-trans isomerase SurA|nr:peptidylprolyl isomerase [Gemmatimonadota bacterium]
MKLSSGILGLLAAFSLLLPPPVEGQGPPLGINLVERVVAVVGDSVILMTELDEFLLTMEARGWSRPTGPAELLEARLDVLDQLINQQLILQEAAKDTLLEVTEEELEDRVQQEIDGQVRQFGTLGRLQQMLAEQNMTMAVFREQKKNAIRRQLLQDRYFAKRGQDASSIVVTEEEARKYFEENQDLIPERPPSIRFENTQLRPEPSDSAKAVALARADSVRVLLRDGGDFPELAARFSDGPSASSGGELGWMRRDGSYVPAFEEVAFGMPPGSISAPVETEFGYHLVLVERIRGAERRVRHIVFQPEITDSDVEANDARAESFVARLRAGETIVDLGLSPDTATLSLAQIAQTSQAFATAMQNAQVGDVIGPVRVDDPRSEYGWTLARVLETTAGGSAEFFEFRDVIVERLQSQGLTESVVEGLRSKVYIDIRLGAR